MKSILTSRTPATRGLNKKQEATGAVRAENRIFKDTSNYSTKEKSSKARKAIKSLRTKVKKMIEK